MPRNRDKRRAARAELTSTTLRDGPSRLRHWGAPEWAAYLNSVRNLSREAHEIFDACQGETAALHASDD